MKKTLTKISATLIAILFSVGVVTAHTPTVIIDDIAPLSYATFPQTYNVTGSIEHYAGSGGTGGVAEKTEVNLYIDDVQEGPTAIYGNGSLIYYSLPWNIERWGTYNVKVSAKRTFFDGVGYAEETAIVERQVGVSQCVAAPSVAAQSLKEKGLQPGNSTYENVVAKVAQKMGERTDFEGVTACAASYDETVESFVEANLAL